MVHGKPRVEASTLKSMCCAGRMASEGLFKMARNLSGAQFLQSAPDLRAPVVSCAQVCCYH